MNIRRFYISLVASGAILSIALTLGVFAYTAQDATGYLSELIVRSMVSVCAIEILICIMIWLLLWGIGGFDRKKNDQSDLYMTIFKSYVVPALMLIFFLASNGLLVAGVIAWINDRLY
jgi:uncharacterized oligopeptide transporter (OPT) family protein